MKVLHQFATLEQAHLAVSFLENEGIQAHVWDEQISALYPMFNPSIGMVRVAVHEHDFQHAHEVLTDYLKLMQQETD
ncbi:MAG: DUF2007 domain-containing protein [Puniceicoccaceae bacterium]